MYAFGCSGGVLQVIALPLMEKISRRFKIRDKIFFRTDVLGIGQVSYFEMLAFILAYGLGFSWILVAFFTTDPNSYTFFWVTQDIMGACMCIMFLSLIKLNSIRVASLLLTIAFLYDIFFVFITPMIFNGDSVMITVATSGGAPKADPSWCEKYPDDKDCLGGDPLPMLFTIPRFFDYQGGASLLGLGDIVLPGLLLSFAARLDAAKHLVGLMVGGRGISHSNTCPEGRKCFGSCTCMGLFNGGYFGPLVVAYGIGLLMANVAVYKFQMGQPALLYLVPCCLGTMVYMGWRRNELNQMWEGARTIKAADKLVYGEEEGQDGSMMPLPTDEESEFASVPSALDKQ